MVNNGQQCMDSPLLHLKHVFLCNVAVSLGEVEQAERFHAPYMNPKCSFINCGKNNTFGALDGLFGPILGPVRNSRPGVDRLIPSGEPLLRQEQDLNRQLGSSFVREEDFVRVGTVADGAASRYLG